MLWSYSHRLFTLGFDDFMLWFVHLIGHQVRFFWCIHGVHHTAEEMKMSVTIRGSFLGFHLDRNYGETFSIWDRIFGTFQSELHDVRPMYGIINDKINSKNFLQVQFQLWKDLWYDIVRAPRFIDKIRYVIMPPGWNHIDGGKKASAYRSDATEAHKLASSSQGVEM